MILKTKEVGKMLAIKNAIGDNKYIDYGTQTIGLPRWA